MPHDPEDKKEEVATADDAGGGVGEGEGETETGNGNEPPPKNP